MFTGIIIAESLENPEIINDLDVFKAQIETNINWHTYWVNVDDAGLDLIKKNLLPNKWYAHFAKQNSDDAVVIFKDKMFALKQSDRQTWRDAIDYGIQIGIPPQQMDFEF